MMTITTTMIPHIKAAKLKRVAAEMRGCVGDESVNNGAAKLIAVTPKATRLRLVLLIGFGCE